MKIAIVDDMQEDIQCLAAYLQRYQKEYDCEIKVEPYHSSIDFLEEYRGQYDIIFLDIEMPGSDGIETAKEIRSKDSNVGLIFVTNMAQYAIKGYEVNAIDFVVKPVGYYVFVEKMQKAISFYKKRESKTLLLNREDGIYKILMSDILYIEKDKDYLIFHTIKGEFRERGTLKMLKNKLEGSPFSECTYGCLVNIAKVTRVGKEDISLDEMRLPMSRRMKRQFTQDYLEYIGGGF